MICVSVQEKTLQGCLAVLKDSPMAELRADLCQLSIGELEQAVASHPNLLITCRIANSSESFAREQLTAALRRGARYVDVEIEAPESFLAEIRDCAHTNGTRLIVSYHDFDGTPSLEELRRTAAQCREKGADIVKIVTTAHTITDAVRTLKLYETDEWKNPGAPALVAFSMGDAGRFSRYLCLHLGAPYTYVSYGCGQTTDPSLCGAPTAPGQYTLQEMMHLLQPGPFEAPHSLEISSALIPCSKSVAQRAILGAAFACGESTLENFEPCNDINGAIEVARGLGCDVTVTENAGQKTRSLHIKSPGIEPLKEHLKSNGDLSLHVGESGLLTRLLIPLAAYLSGEGHTSNSNREVTITGRGSLLNRDLESAATAVRNAGATCTTHEGHLPFCISGGIQNQQITFSGKESSQIVSGFLMTLPLLDKTTELVIEQPTSIPYIQLTLRVLEQFGIEIHARTQTRTAQDDSVVVERLIYEIPGGQHYLPSRLFLDPDWSSAAFFAVAFAIASAKKGGAEYILKNMPLDSNQADESILKVLEQCGVELRYHPTNDGEPKRYDIAIRATTPLRAFDFDATHCPDLFPILAVLACHCTGTSRIKGVNRLLQKESNRAETILTEFTVLGGHIEIEDDFMYIAGEHPDGSDPLHGGNVHSHNDHRIAMSLIIAALFTADPVRLDDIKCIDKSFPSFLNILCNR